MTIKPTIIPKHGIKPTPTSVETTTVEVEEAKKPTVISKIINSTVTFVMIISLGWIAIGTIQNAIFSPRCGVNNLNSYIEVETSTQCLIQNNNNSVVPVVSKKIETDPNLIKDRTEGSLIANTQAQNTITNNGEFCLVNGMAVRKSVINGVPLPCKF